MKHHTLREIAKVLIGLFAADIICGTWLAAAGMLPITLFGVSWGAGSIIPGVLFDAAVIIILAHYAWRTKLPIKSPTERGLLVVVGLIFLMMLLAHLARLAFGLSFVIDAIAIPLWLSWFGVLVLAYLSYSSFHFALKK